MDSPIQRPGPDASHRDTSDLVARCLRGDAAAWTKLVQRYAGWSGTSMAAAFVSGAMALERQRYPQASVAELGQWVKERAISLDGLNPNFAGALGGGLLDVRALLDVSPTLIFAPQLQR